MVGLVVATHGRLADELVATAEQIVGKLGSVETVSIEPGSAPEKIRSQMQQAVHDMDSGDGVIVLADLFGGTPCKESLMLCQNCHLEVLAGVNLPMLLKANSLRMEQMNLSDMAHALALYGQKNITCASDLLRAANSGSTKSV
jgi:PTS system mannose-specific IIA component